MRIIGESKDNYIVEVPFDEMANIQGLHSRFSYVRENIKKPECGDVINIEQLYNLITRIKSTIGNIEKFRQDLSFTIKRIDDFHYTADNLTK